MEKILKADASLCVDVVCYDCKRRVAMSNTCEIDGRRYCHSCTGGLFTKTRVSSI